VAADQLQDGHRLARGHPASHVVPAVLALAEERDLDGRAVLSAVLAAMGFAIASIGRNTAASVGAGFGYLLVAEGLLAALVDWIRPILITPNAVTFVAGDPIGDVGLDSVPAAGILLACYAIGFLAIAVFLFRARDVT
jgi:hypothetical protein